MERRADRDLSDIIGFDDKTFDAVMPFLTSIGQIQEEIAEATDLASIERLCAKGAVEPLVTAAIGSKDPRRCLMPLVDIGHEQLSYWCKAALRVSHCCGRISIYRATVSMNVNQWISSFHSCASFTIASYTLLSP